MSNLELVLNMLAEASTTEISKDKKPKTFNENKIVAKKVAMLQKPLVYNLKVPPEKKL